MAFLIITDQLSGADEIRFVLPDVVLVTITKPLEEIFQTSFSLIATMLKDGLYFVLVVSARLVVSNGTWRGRQSLEGIFTISAGRQVGDGNNWMDPRVGRNVKAIRQATDTLQDPVWASPLLGVGLGRAPWQMVSMMESKKDHVANVEFQQSMPVIVP